MWNPCEQECRHNPIDVQNDDPNAVRAKLPPWVLVCRIRRLVVVSSAIETRELAMVPPKSADVGRQGQSTSRCETTRRAENTTYEGFPRTK